MHPGLGEIWADSCFVKCMEDADSRDNQPAEKSNAIQDSTLPNLKREEEQGIICYSDQLRDVDSNSLHTVTTDVSLITA